MGTWSFRARLGGNHARTCARARRRRRRCRAGYGPGPGSGFGSLPGLVLFESGLTGLGYEHTRSAIQIRIAPPTDPLRVSWTANSCDCWVKPLQRFRPNRCNFSLGSGPVGPSWSAINSAPNSQLKDINNTKFRKTLLSLSLNVLNCKVSSELGSEVLK